MSDNLFSLLKQKFEVARKTGDFSKHGSESLRWYYQYIQKNIQRMNALEGLTSGRWAEMPTPGNFYVYTYDPKFKATLPYYDTVPLILCTAVTKTGFYGLNLHYMPPKVRLKIMDEIIATTKTHGNENLKIKMSWQKAVQIGFAVGKDRYLSHSIKQYLTKQVRSNLIKVKDDNLEAMIFLPIARFKKASQEKVWADV